MNKMKKESIENAFLAVFAGSVVLSILLGLMAKHILVWVLLLDVYAFGFQIRPTKAMYKMSVRLLAIAVVISLYAVIGLTRKGFDVSSEILSSQIFSNALIYVLLTVSNIFALLTVDSECKKFV